MHTLLPRPGGLSLDWLTAPEGAPRERRYLFAAAIASAAIWSVALAVMLAWPRSFTVESSLIVPNGDPETRVDLKEVGQAYATARSTYDSKSLDPRVNYKEIMLSADVLEAAAAAVGMEAKEFDEPRVKLIDQSSVMSVRTKAGSADLALRKANALHDAFQKRLNQLRLDELTQREQAIEQAIRNSRDRLSDAQKDLVVFKTGAQIVTEKQLDEMALQSTTLTRRHDELSQKVAHDLATAQSLSEQLGVSPALAGWTLTLQGDAVFLEHFRQFAATSAQLGDYAHKWDAGHPKVREAAGARDGAMAAMALRARTVIGSSVDDASLHRMAMVLQDRSRDLLLRDLVAAQAGAQSARAELSEIDRQRARLAGQLPKLAGESAQLDSLQRRVNFAEAVFTGAAGKTDVGHTSIFSSYPMVQTLVAPSLPRKPSSPRLLYVAAGAMLASLLVLTGLSLAWLRNKQR